ncbi:MAG TPA: mechanosensitive ion channel domain-containing protein [Gammaproteobacteria bacterium]|nr:mechanosensitive ion channel domain-containing protein [Gammaproteobacteria bacterium]
MIRNRPIFRVLASCLLVFAFSGSGAQDTLSKEEFQQLLDSWNFKLSQAETELVKRGATEPLLASIREDVRKIQEETASVAKSSDEQAARLLELLQALGPPPGEDASPEEESVAQRRTQLRDQLAMFEGRVKQAELTAERARQLLERQSARLRQKAAEELFYRQPSPVSWSVLSGAGPHFLSALRQLGRAPLEAWAPAISGSASLAGALPLLLATVLAFVIGWPVRRWLIRSYVRDRETGQPTYTKRVVNSVMVGISRGVLPALLAAAPLGVLLARGTSRGIAGDMLVAALIGIISVVLIAGISRAALAPASPTGWRLTPLTDKSARALYRRIRQVMVIAAILFFIEFPARRHLYISEELRIFYNFVGDTVLAVFIFALLPKRLWQTVEPTEVDELAPAARMNWKVQVLRGAVAVAAIAIPVSSLLGFVTFASYLTNNLLLTGLVLGGFVVFHGLVRELLTIALEREAGERVPAEEEEERRDSSWNLLRFWLVAAFDFALLLAAVLLLLWAWGFGLADFREWTRLLVGGFKIGKFTVSPADLLIAVVVFVAILFATRTLQRVLENRIFPQTRLDAGIRHSLKTSVGYIGLVIAAAIAISALGLDLSNIAIIAGALSVGIGFGLQNIVNNFVSGLILLVERPVKVGDWVEVGAHQGYVKRINVRATELQTFQRSSVIIPNSELLSSSVVNWTHKDTLARVDISVGVSYGSDIELVRETLLECASSHPNCIPDPSPFVLFLNFGDSALEFDVRFYVARADEMFRTGSEVRFAIVHAFRKKGIEIPFPQRDLHVRTVVEGMKGPRLDNPGSGEKNSG